MPRHPKPSHRWRNIAFFALLGVVAFWTLSRVPRFEASHEARHEVKQQVSQATPNTANHGVFSEDIVQQSVTSTSRFRLLLSTHNRLFWYYPATKEDVAVHEGQVRSSCFLYVYNKSALHV